MSGKLVSLPALLLMLCLIGHASTACREEEDLDAALEAAAAYRYGDSRGPLLRIEHWIGICYLPGFSFGILPQALQRLIVGITQTIEPTIRLQAAKWGYGIGVRAVKME